MYATGFTAITALAFGPDGKLFVSEWTTGFGAMGPLPDGDVIVVPRGGGLDGRETLGAGSLHFPTGVAYSHGAVYVSNWGILTGEDGPFGPGNHGQLVKITLTLRPVIDGTGRERADRLGDGAPRLFEPLLVFVRGLAGVAVGIASAIAEAVVGEVAQLLFDRGEPLHDCLVAIILHSISPLLWSDAHRRGRLSPPSAPRLLLLIECGREQVRGVANVEAGLAQLHHAAGIGRHDDRARPGAPQRVGLTIADVG